MSFIEGCKEVANTSPEENSSTSGSTKRKSERQSTLPTKKPKSMKKATTTVTEDEEFLTLELEMKKVKLVDLKTWAMKKLENNLIEETDLLAFCQILFPTETNEFSILCLVTIIFVICPLPVVETVIHPKKWTTTGIQSIWENTMILQASSMTKLYNLMRKSMTTSLPHLDVNWLQNLSLESIGMSAESLCRVELGEFKTVCENWTNLLSVTPQHISTSSPNTTITYTSATCVGTREDLAGAPSSFEEHFGASTEDVDFVGFLEALTSGQQITETYCDTYFRAADASTALEASERMEDYLIDINIYRRKDIWDKPKGEYWLGAMERCRGTFPANHQAVNYASRIVKLLGEKMIKLKNLKRVRKTPGFARKTGR
ncbi:unnamed protein product [Macrosiphum euphorbiae]|uniref:Uncharacterized protein n=1 Tax=Macrosiphum euphorbiae TaxID=13131 RepID=A0AAV0Y1U1_9HEMI|nr:unnamed protein product [Macrosiphum euphorbiae]